MVDKVLIVDDSDFDRRMIRKSLVGKCADISFTELESGFAVTEVLDTLRPDIAILDIRMPGMNGFEVLKLIRSTPGCEDITVLMVSGSEEAADRELASEGGANGYFVKPPSVTDYLTMGRSIYDQYLCCEAP